MRNAREIIEIIKEIISEKTGSKTTFRTVANRLEIEANTLTGWMNRNNFNAKKIAEFCEEENISLDYLLLGIDPRSGQTLVRESETAYGTTTIDLGLFIECMNIIEERIKSNKYMFATRPKCQLIALAYDEAAARPDKKINMKRLEIYFQLAEAAKKGKNQ